MIDANKKSYFVDHRNEELQQNPVRQTPPPNNEQAQWYQLLIRLTGRHLHVKQCVSQSNRSNQNGGEALTTSARTVVQFSKVIT
jgi:hypothetical protein